MASSYKLKFSYMQLSGSVSQTAIQFLHEMLSSLLMSDQEAHTSECQCTALQYIAMQLQDVNFSYNISISALDKIDLQWHFDSALSEKILLFQTQY